MPCDLTHIVARKTVNSGPAIAISGLSLSSYLINVAFPLISAWEWRSAWLFHQHLNHRLSHGGIGQGAEVCRRRNEPDDVPVVEVVSHLAKRRKMVERIYRIPVT